MVCLPGEHKRNRNQCENTGFRKELTTAKNYSLQEPTIENTFSIVVIHYPDNRLQIRLASIRRQTAGLIIVDNGSTPEIQAVLKTFLESSTGNMVLKNNHNMGLGHALNQGIEVVIRKGMTWALLFDQDTDIDDRLLEQVCGLVSSISPLPAIFGCNYRDKHKGRVFLNCAESESSCIERKTVITSGSLLNLDAYKVLGGFRSDYFIDSIDHEYCLRARSKGYRVFISCMPLMTHSIGARFSKGKKFSRLLNVHRHSPVRKYYMARNTLATVRQYWRYETLWCTCQLARIIVETLSILLYENSKSAKLGAVLRGSFDGLRLRFSAGPLEKDNG